MVTEGGTGVGSNLEPVHSSVSLEQGGRGSNWCLRGIVKYKIEVLMIQNVSRESLSEMVYNHKLFKTTSID